MMRNTDIRTTCRTFVGLIAAIMAAITGLSACSNPLAEAVKAIKAEAASPRLVVTKSNGTSIASGDTFDFGTDSSATLTITNTGKSDLIIDLSAISWTWGSGTVIGDFTLINLPSVVGAGKTAEIQASFGGSGLSLKTAILTIPTNDVKNKAFVINVKGQHGATDLTALAIIDGIPLYPAFNSATTDYFIYLPNSTTTILGITPYKANTGATLTTNPGSLSPIALNVGLNPITVTVSFEGSADKVYTINVGRATAPPVMATPVSGPGEISGLTPTAVNPIVDSFNLYWSTSPGVTTSNGTKISNITLPYTHAGLSPNSTYYYIMTTVSAGSESLASTEVSALTYPAAPSATKATIAGGGELILTWAAPASGADSYNIYYSTNSGVTKAAPHVATGITGTSTTITGLTNWTPHYFKIAAVNGGGESAALSNEITGTPVRQEVILVNPAGSVDFNFVNTSTWTYTQPSPHYLTASGSAYSVAVDPDLKAVYVANNATSGTYFAVGTYRPFDTSTGSAPDYVPGETHAEGVGADHVLTVVTPEGNKFLYTAYTGSNFVYTYGIDANGIISLTNTKVTNLRSPRYLCADPSGKFLYISNIGATGAYGVTACSINSTTGALTYINGGTSNPDASSYTTGSGPFRMAIDPSGKHLYVVNNSSSTVSAFTIASDGKLSSIASYATGSAPTGVAVAPSGNFLFVTNAFSNSVSAFAIAADGSLSGKVDYAGAVNKPSCIAIDATGTFAVVTNAGTGVNNATVFSIDPATGILTGKFVIPTGAGPSHVIIVKLP